jgi:hypothetical protein
MIEDAGHSPVTIRSSGLGTPSELRGAAAGNTRLQFPTESPNFIRVN